MIKNYKMSPFDTRTSGANWSHSLPYELTIRTFDQFDHWLLKLFKFA